MTDDRTRVDDLVDDILECLDELAAALDRHRLGIAESPDGLLDRPRWVLIGMGSSGFAARDALAAALRSVGRDAVAEVASASGGTPPGADTLAIVISNSGGTAQAVAAAARHRHQSRVLALTAEPRSALAAEADAVLPLVGERAEKFGDRDALVPVDRRRAAAAGRRGRTGARRHRDRGGGAVARVAPR